MSNKKSFSDDTDVFAALGAVEEKTKKTNKAIVAIDTDCERMTFFLPKTIKKALKSRVYNSEDPNEKNMSAIVRLALEQYLGM
jgi:hypothetical protein